MANWRTMFHEFNGELVGIGVLLFVGFSGCVFPKIIPMVTKLSDDDCGRSVCGNSTPVLMKRGGTVHNLKVGNLFLLVIALAFGAGIAGAILFAGEITGGHFNPAVTIALVSLGKVPPSKLVHYLPAQYIGAFLAAMAIDFVYMAHIETKDRDGFLRDAFVLKPHDTANLWITTADGILSGWVFMMFISAVGDKYGSKVPRHIQPVYIVLCFIGILLAFAGNAGAALNPARDLGPKLYAALFIGLESSLGHLNYCFWWLSQQFGITLGFVAGGWTYYGLFEVKPPK